MSRACWRISAAALGSGRPISKRRHSASCSDDSGITLSAHTKLCVTRGCVKMFLVARGTPGRVQLPVLFRREILFATGGCRWFAIHSACSASRSHSRIRSSKPALRVGSRVSCPRCSARLACSRYHCALESMPIELSKNQRGSRNEPHSGCVILVDPGLFPSPSTVRGQGTPPSGPLPWRGSVNANHASV
jgi:hypothetical protein